MGAFSDFLIWLECDRDLAGQGGGEGSSQSMGGTLASAHPWKMGVEGQGVKGGSMEAFKRGKEVK